MLGLYTTSPRDSRVFILPMVSVHGKGYGYQRALCGRGASCPASAHRLYLTGYAKRPIIAVGMLPDEKKQRRRKRLESLLLNEISALLASSVKDPGCRGVVLTRLRVSTDLSQALVMVRARREAQDVTGDAVLALNRAAGFIRRELHAQLALKRTPRLKFIEDRGIVESVRISTILNRLRSEGKISDAGVSSGDPVL